MTRLPSGDVLTRERLADLQAYARGEQPDLQPLRLTWHRRHGYLEPCGPRGAPHDEPVNRRIPPRAHRLTDKGREAVEAAGPARFPGAYRVTHDQNSRAPGTRATA